MIICQLLSQDCTGAGGGWGETKYRALVLDVRYPTVTVPHTKCISLNVFNIAPIFHYKLLLFLIAVSNP